MERGKRRFKVFLPGLPVFETPKLGEPKSYIFEKSEGSWADRIFIHLCMVFDKLGLEWTRRGFLHPCN